jgi:hypothetical protein
VNLTRKLRRPEPHCSGGEDQSRLGTSDSAPLSERRTKVANVGDRCDTHQGVKHPCSEREPLRVGLDEPTSARIGFRARGLQHPPGHVNPDHGRTLGELDGGTGRLPGASGDVEDPLAGLRIE